MSSVVKAYCISPSYLYYVNEDNYIAITHMGERISKANRFLESIPRNCEPRVLNLAQVEAFENIIKPNEWYYDFFCYDSESQLPEIVVPGYQFWKIIDGNTTFLMVRVTAYREDVKVQENYCLNEILAGDKSVNSKALLSFLSLYQKGLPASSEAYFPEVVQLKELLAKKFQNIEHHDTLREKSMTFSDEIKQKIENFLPNINSCQKSEKVMNLDGLFLPDSNQFSMLPWFKNIKQFSSQVKVLTKIASLPDNQSVYGINKLKKTIITLKNLSNDLQFSKFACDHYLSTKDQCRLKKLLSFFNQYLKNFNDSALNDSTKSIAEKFSKIVELSIFSVILSSELKKIYQPAQKSWENSIKLCFLQIFLAAITGLIAPLIIIPIYNYQKFGDFSPIFNPWRNYPEKGACANFCQP